MIKRCVALFFVFTLIFSLTFVVAQEDDLDVDGELGDGGSINGFDRFIDSIFQNDLENMRERFAEVRTLIRNGEVEEARELLRHYRDVADELENEVSPDQRDEAVRLSRIIRAAIDDLRDEIPEDFREDFDDASERAENVGTAAEIASQIRDLCKQLHDQVAWDQFEQVCKTDEDGPRWQRDYFDDLSDEQREQAEDFVDAIGSCMKDPDSDDCRCDVANEEFELLCEEIVESEKSCRDGNEDACEVADRAGGDVYESLKDLPHLRRALEKLDQNFEDSHEERFDNHIPGVCRDAHERGEIDLFGPNGREECFPLAVRERAPQPCIDALDRGDLPDDDEFGFRSGCEDLMREQGFDDHGDFDGERRGPPGHAPAVGFRCNEDFKDDPEGRLKCFDEAFANAQSHFDERFDERRERFEGHRDSFRDFEATCPIDERVDCLNKGGRWDCRNGFVECFEGEFDDFDRRHRDFDDHDRREFRDIGRDRYRDRPLFDCAVVSCFDGQYCDPYEGCVDDYDEEGFDCYEFGSRDACEPHCYWDTVNDKCFSFDYDHEGDGSEIDDTGCYGEDPCPVYSKCVDGVYECYGEENQFNDPSNPDYDPTRGGDGTSCASGYEESNGNCVPFGEGDYDHEEESSGSEDSESDSSESDSGSDESGESSGGEDDSESDDSS